RRRGECSKFFTGSRSAIPRPAGTGLALSSVGFRHDRTYLRVSTMTGGGFLCVGFTGLPRFHVDHRVVRLLRYGRTEFRRRARARFRRPGEKIPAGGGERDRDGGAVDRRAAGRGTGFGG